MIERTLAFLGLSGGKKTSQSENTQRERGLRASLEKQVENEKRQAAAVEELIRKLEAARSEMDYLTAKMEHLRTEVRAMQANQKDLEEGMKTIAATIDEAEIREIVSGIERIPSRDIQTMRRRQTLTIAMMSIILIGALIAWLTGLIL
jgi:seryl-tRNA synthetase